jgi:hypothetical protein
MHEKAPEDLRMYEVFRNTSKTWGFHTPHGLESRKTKPTAIEHEELWKYADTVASSPEIRIPTSCPERISPSGADTLGATLTQFD